MNKDTKKYFLKVPKGLVYSPEEKYYIMEELRKKVRYIEREAYKEFMRSPNGKQKRKEYLTKNKDRISQYRRDYQKKYQKQRYKKDVNFTLRMALRKRLNGCLKNKSKRVGSAVRDLGCSIEEFKLYIEKQFTEGMTWKNYGQWHLDHIIPLNIFDLTDRQQFLKACHYTNIRPLWKKDNLRRPRDGSDIL